MKSLNLIVAIFVCIIAGGRFVKKLKFDSVDSYYVGIWGFALLVEFYAALETFLEW